MKKLAMKLSKGKRLALNAAVIVLILPLVWGLLGFPLPTKEAAFRRSMSDYGWPKADPDMVVKLEDGRYAGIRSDADRVYLAEVIENELVGWGSNGVAWSVPTVEGVRYTPFDWWSHLYDIHSSYFNKYGYGFSFAVKAKGADASLTLVLEENGRESDSRSDDQEPGVYRYPFILEQTENGWFIFQWDSKVMGNDFSRSGISDNYRALVRHRNLQAWMAYYSTGGSKRAVDASNNWAAQIYQGLTARYGAENESAQKYNASVYLELTTRDEAGNVLEQRSWELP